MHPVKFLIIIYISLLSLPSKSQITILSKDTNTSMRGLCAVDDKVVWACGSKGWIAKSVDGKNFRFWQPKGYEKCEFRDVEAFDSSTAFVLAVTRPAIILKTTDGGDKWIETFRSDDTNMFFDAISFWDNRHGIAIGDPLDLHFVTLRASHGKYWEWLDSLVSMQAKVGESMFAASGTCLRALDKDSFAFVTGGTISRLYIQGRTEKYSDTYIYDIDSNIMQQGNSGAGTFSFCPITNKPNSFILVGGDYTKENLAEKNAVIIKNGKQINPKKLPGGYRECVEQAGRYYICCGPNGVDISKDGDVWESYSKEGFHVVQKAKKGKKIFLAGGKGKIGVIGSIK